MNSSTKIFVSYSKSIFHDEVPLLILAWLERTGETKESDIASAIGKEQHEVKRSLLGLHENSFVTYKQNSVRIAESGKEVLDRLGVAEKIVESALETLKIPIKYRLGLEHLLNQYRDSAYEYYLDTQASMISYNHFHHACHFSIAETKASQDFLTVAGLAIIFRDLRNWMRHSIEGLSSRLSLNHSSGSIKELRFLTDSAWNTGIQSSSSIRRSLNLLSWCEDHPRTITETAAELEQTDRAAFDKIFLIFDDFQRRNKRENWFDRWNQAYKESELSQPSGKLSIYYEHLVHRSHGYSDTTGIEHGEWEGWWDKMPASYFTPKIVDHSSVALGNILTARTLKEFCENTDLDHEASLLLLKRIGSKIHNLLNED